MKYGYAIKEWGEDFGDAEEFESSFDLEYLEWIAEDAAQAFYDNREGYEYADSGSLPNITIYSEEGKELGTFHVSLEYSPVFHATKE